MFLYFTDLELTSTLECSIQHIFLINIIKLPAIEYDIFYDHISLKNSKLELLVYYKVCLVFKNCKNPFISRYLLLCMTIK